MSMAYEVNIDWKAFGDDLMRQAESKAGLKNVATLLGIPYQRLWRIRMGQEPKAGDFLVIAQWLRGKPLWP